MSKTADIPLAGSRGAYEFPVGDELRGERATLGRSLLDVQRDLRIKAAYVAAIEDADPSVFPNPSFIPGYVRSYARYLGRDPEEVYARFRAESGFVGPTAVPGGARAAGSAAKAGGKSGAKPGAGVFHPNFPMAERRWRGAPAVPVSALGSLLVLAALVAGLGYGGWTVLQNIQRVQFAPVEEAPVALAAVDPLASPAAPDGVEPALSDLARPVAATALAELYRSQELEVPILTPRDGPIAALDPDRVGLLARVAAPRPAPAAAPTTPGAAPAAGRGAPGLPGLAAAAVSAAPPADPDAPQLTAEPPTVTVVAERAAWIRVYLADKTVIFERILETGESYSPPADLVEPLIWAGNSGSVYVRLGDTLRGPLGSGTRAVRDVVLAPAAIEARFAEVADVPKVLSGPAGPASDPPLEATAVVLQ